MPIDRETNVYVTAMGDGLILARMTGFDEVSRPYSFVAEVLSKDPAIKASDVLGTALSIRVDSDTVRHFHGLVAEFALTDVRTDLSHYQLRVVPWVWFLSRRTENRIFQNKSVVEIVDEVCKPYPHQKITKRLQKSYPPREYCVQYGETDLDFVQRLLEHEGIFYFFDYADGDHAMVLVDANAALKPGEGAEKLPYRPMRGSSSFDEDHVFDWKPRATVLPGKYAQTDYDFEKPSSDLMSKASGPLGHAGDGQENYHYPGNYVVHARGDKLSGVRLEELQAPHVRVAARMTSPNLWSGRTFTLEDFPSDAENAAYVVLRAEYDVRDERYIADSVSESAHSYNVTMMLAPLSRPYRPDRRTPRPLMRGPQTAKVVGPAGSEIFTDKYGRVKVQFHWDRNGKHDENTTCMIRVSQTWAGAGWGFIQIPRIGQEVIVDFLEGDPDQPIITGRVYNAEQVVPYGLPGNATQSGWKSNSSPGGGGFNELRFEDKAGSEEVYFQAQKDHNELIKHNEGRRIGNDFAENVGHDARQSVGNNRTESVGNDKSVSVGNNRSVSIGVNDDETVGSNRSLSVGANETISVGSNSTESIGANHAQTVAVAQAITVGAAQAVTVGGSRADSVGASETRTVGGPQSNTIGAARSVTVGSGQTHAVGSDDGWTVGAGQTVSVGADQGFTVGGGQSTKVGKDQLTDVAGARAVKVGADQAHDVAGAMAIKVGKAFAVDAADSITLKTGSAAIIMKKDGTITIEGKDITITGSGKINVKASGEVTVKGSKINNN